MKNHESRFMFHASGCIILPCPSSILIPWNYQPWRGADLPCWDASGALLQAGDLIGLSGDLGAGKTTFVQGSAGWGSLDLVTSPTFVLVNVYRRGDDAARRLYHLDAYRLDSAAEAEELDLMRCWPKARWW
jgi:hypothetical protein